MTIHGLIFDLDGTLTLTQQLHQQAYTQIFNQHGIEYTLEDDKNFAGQGSSIIFPKVFAKHGKTLTTEETEKFAEQKKELYDKIVDQTKIKTVRGIQTFLQNAEELGLKMVVATGNKFEATQKILGKAGILNYFESIISQKDVKHQKPAPDIFLAGCEKMGLKPEECIVFEDALNGVKAAKAAGILCIGISTSFPTDALKKAGADWTFTDYCEIDLNLLTDLNPSTAETKEAAEQKHQ